MKKYSDVWINIPESRKAFIQELHLPVYHALCLRVEGSLFRNASQTQNQTYQQNSPESYSAQEH